jgi:hypothetical protein
MRRICSHILYAGFLIGWVSSGAGCSTASRYANEQGTQNTDPKIQRPSSEPKTTSTLRQDGHSCFGNINATPIKDQIQRLYQAEKDGKLIIPDGKFKVGVSGSVNPDGALADCRLHIPSGIQDIDDSAKAILAAVSESRALGPLSQLTSITMVLDIDQNARLIVTGFTRNETDAVNIVNLAQTAIFVARFKKSDEQAARVLLNNLKVYRTGTRIQSVIRLPKEMAKETLARIMDK